MASLVWSQGICAMRPAPCCRSCASKTEDRMEALTATAVLPEPFAMVTETPQPSRTGRVPRLVLLYPVASSALLWAAYFPLSWGWLGWIALVPLLTLVRMRTPTSRACRYGWLCGLLFFLSALQWLRVADYRMYATWIALAIYCSFYFPLTIYLLRRLERRSRLPLL